MYLEHFGLDEAPFRITPHTDFFFDGADRGATLEGLLYAIQYDEGIVKVSGEVGSGKTMLCRVLMERLPAHVETIYLANPSLTRDEILMAIADDLKLKTTGGTARVLTRELQDHLIESHASGRRVVILIDEAHAMPEDSLEQVRLLSNLETSRHKLLQIVLFGQPELDQMLAAKALRQLRDRVTHSFRMRPLTEEEVRRYVTFRLRAAGYRGPDLFTPRAIALLARASDGLTRRINVLADKALLSAFALDTHGVDEKHVRRAIADSELSPIVKARRPLAYVAAALAAGAVLGMILQWAFTTHTPEPAVTAPAARAGAGTQGPADGPANPKAAPGHRLPEKPVVVPKQQSPSPALVAIPAQPVPIPAEGSATAKVQPPAPSERRDSPAPSERAAETAKREPDAPAKPVATVPVASTPLLAKAISPPSVSAVSQSVPARLLPKQIERIDAYATGGMPLLSERIAATRELLQTAPDTTYSIELYRTLNTDPARLERFLIRARAMGSLSEIYVLPLTAPTRTRLWVVYGVYESRSAAKDALDRVPAQYHKDFQLVIRDFAELRRAI